MLPVPGVHVQQRVGGVVAERREARRHHSGEDGGRGAYEVGAGDEVRRRVARPVRGGRDQQVSGDRGDAGDPEHAGPGDEAALAVEGQDLYDVRLLSIVFASCWLCLFIDLLFVFCLTPYRGEDREPLPPDGLRRAPRGLEEVRGGHAHVDVGELVGAPVGRLGPRDQASEAAGDTGDDLEKQ